ncbi:ParB N-terminal domain-containing protein [Spirochaeta africana]|uniref:Putative transcriptional regulator n=1 Tax=Spirochaeta africana (strain ATCC 700263 / DSM 8902 / Z-7692) TaxID=889378 RepID=H9UKC4_SPIAZ|nr:ParB N-terminal domain-containing protein [Spirochaeta africana]AFG37967.1 putative transcriptional regulator [Spirochaeta africana DSM 8902]
MERNVQDIRIGKRIRHDIGDISSLKESMKRYGMLNPVVITESGTLIAGYRRLQAARELGWSTVRVKIMPNTDEADLIEIEIDENLHRKPFTEDERTDAFLQLERLRNPGLLTRILRGLRSLWRRFLGLFTRSR